MNVALKNFNLLLSEREALDQILAITGFKGPAEAGWIAEQRERGLGEARGFNPGVQVRKKQALGSEPAAAAERREVRAALWGGPAEPGWGQGEVETDAGVPKTRPGTGPQAPAQVEKADGQAGFCPLRRIGSCHLPPSSVTCAEVELSEGSEVGREEGPEMFGGCAALSPPSPLAVLSALV